MKNKILIGTPCYGNSLTLGYFQSMLATVATYAGHPDIEMHVFAFGNESLITRARNVCVAHVLKEDYTHLLFIDADIEFKPEMIERLLKKNADVVCGVYPKKCVDWEKIKNFSSEKLKEMDPQELAANLLTYNVHVSKAPGPYKIAIDQDGFMCVDRVGTGFMLIKRTVFTKMMKQYPNLKYVSDDKSEDNIKDHLWAFFDTAINEERKYMSEDFLFCDRWTSMGGKVWVDVMSALTHIGTYYFKGNYVQSLTIGKDPQK